MVASQDVTYHLSGLRGRSLRWEDRTNQQGDLHNPNTMKATFLYRVHYTSRVNGQNASGRLAVNEEYPTNAADLALEILDYLGVKNVTTGGVTLLRESRLDDMTNCWSSFNFEAAAQA